MTALTDGAEDRVLNWITSNAGATAPTAPLRLRLMTANGSDSAGGTQVVGGTYAPQPVSFSAAGSGAAANTALVRFDGLPAVTVVGVEIWDSAGTPFRWLWGALSSSVTVAAGEPIEFAVGEIDLTAN
jgi:hypothetical protein